MSVTDMAEAVRTVRVALPGREYDILIGRGLLGAAGRHMARLAPGARAAIVTDETVAGLHLAGLEAGLAEAGIATATLSVPAGEASKSFDRLGFVLDRLLEARIERGDLVVALGGGVVGDLAGFAAAILRRGVRMVQVPTTLLAQVDSSVGGKTGINTRHGKNLVGAFHQPGLVLADLATLDTLPARQFRSGYAEVIKYGLLGDADMFAWLEDVRAEIESGGPARAEAVARSCAAKARIVTADEREAGERALLNLGHTFGHALEAATGYGERLLHGEGVAIGMRLAFAFSAEKGLACAEDAARVERHLAEAGLPTRIADIPGATIAADELMTHIAQDKKVARGRLAFVLARGIGRAFIANDVPAQDVRAFLARECARP